MSKEEKDYFIAVYGTLREGFGNNHYMSRCTKVGTGRTEEKYSMFASGIPFVTKEEGPTTIKVEVYKVPHTEIRSIDSLEGHPNWYRREPIQVNLENGEKMEAELYFNRVDPDTTTLSRVESGDYEDHSTYLRR